MTAAAPHLAFFVTEDWYFWSHRLPLARAARDAGYRVTVITRVHRHGEQILSEGFELVDFPLRRASLNPLRDAVALLRLVRLLRRLRPQVLHNVALKPVLYGTLAARLAGVPAVIDTFAGLGTLFSGRSTEGSALGRAVLVALRAFLPRKGGRVVVQNEDDAAHLQRYLPAERLRLVRGSGVDTEHYRPLPEPDGPPTVAMVARMIEEKGPAVLAAASALLRERGRPVRVVLAGGVDGENPGALDPALVQGWVEEGLAEWPGEVADVREVWGQAHVAVLTSLSREGLPKALLEAAACQRALIGTDIPGCREIVLPEVTGLLVPPRDPEALATAIARLLDDPELRHRLAAGARRHVVEELSQEVVHRAMLALYREALEERGG